MVSLRKDEKIQALADFHWSAFLKSKIWAGFGLVVFLGALTTYFAGTPEDKSQVASSLIAIPVIFFTPFFIKWLENQSKIYLVTNQRVYLEKGILAKTKIDLPIGKINDVCLTQSFIQRIFGTGNISILTGNNRPTVLKDIDCPEKFKSHISEMVEQKSST